MKYWNDIVEENLSYEEAHEYIKTYAGAGYITRKEWGGIHFYRVATKTRSRNLEYCILTKDGEIIKNPAVIFYKDKNDWMIVTPSESAIKILYENKLIKKVPPINLTSKKRKLN